MNDSNLMTLIPYNTTILKRRISMEFKAVGN